MQRSVYIDNADWCQADDFKEPNGGIRNGFVRDAATLQSKMANPEKLSKSEGDRDFIPFYIKASQEIEESNYRSARKWGT